MADLSWGAVKWWKLVCLEANFQSIFSSKHPFWRYLYHLTSISIPHGCSSSKIDDSKANCPETFTANAKWSFILCVINLCILLYLKTIIAKQSLLWLPTAGREPATTLLWTFPMNTQNPSFNQILCTIMKKYKIKCWKPDGKKNVNTLSKDQWKNNLANVLYCYALSVSSWTVLKMVQETRSSKRQMTEVLRGIKEKCSFAIWENAIRGVH